MSALRVAEQIQAVPIAGAILVIDDSAAIREALTDILTSETEAAVYTAANGHEALRILQQSRGIALILLDMNMPVMNGEQTYQKVQEIAPQVKVIVSSSLSPAEARSRFGEWELPAFLQKPYDLRTLLNLVQLVCPASV